MADVAAMPLDDECLQILGALGAAASALAAASHKPLVDSAAMQLLSYLENDAGCIAATQPPAAQGAPSSLLLGLSPLLMILGDCMMPLFQTEPGLFLML